jgi:hypothetical protein
MGRFPPAAWPEPGPTAVAAETPTSTADHDPRTFTASSRLPLTADPDHRDRAQLHGRYT